MRGKLLNAAARTLTSRITPAHAGKTLEDFSDSFADKDHPRACGENSVKARKFKRGTGSPPRMRGKPKKQKGLKGGVWITPAHAGKTAFPKRG